MHIPPGITIIYCVSHLTHWVIGQSSILVIIRTSLKLLLYETGITLAGWLISISALSNRFCILHFCHQLTTRGHITGWGDIILAAFSVLAHHWVRFDSIWSLLSTSEFPITGCQARPLTTDGIGRSGSGEKKSNILLYLHIFFDLADSDHRLVTFGYNLMISIYHLLALRGF